MGGKQSTTVPRLRPLSEGDPGSSGLSGASAVTGSSTGARIRARSLSNFHSNGQSPSLNLSIPTTNGASISGAGSPDSDSSSPEDNLFGRAFTHSLPVQLFALSGIKCPVCSKMITPDDLECHLVMCLTKPRISYNEDVLAEDKEECVICLEDLQQGDTIARLPCLCIYHKGCIDKWFEVNRSCPEHPAD